MLYADGLKLQIHVDFFVLLKLHLHFINRHKVKKEKNI